MANTTFELVDQDPESEWPYCAKVPGYPDWVMHRHWLQWLEHSGIAVTNVGTSFYFRSDEDRMQFVMAWS